MRESRKPVSGSATKHEAHEPVGRPDHHHQLRVVVVLNPQEKTRETAAHHAKLRRRLRARPGKKIKTTHHDLHRLRHDPTHFEMVTAFAQRHDLTIMSQSTHRHDVTLSGSVASLNRAFGTELEHFRHPSGHTYHGHRHNLELPAELHGAVDAVLGLDAAPALRSCALQTGAQPLLRPEEIEAHYHFPNTSGAGQRIALLTFGGGFHESDRVLQARACSRPLPTLQRVRLPDATDQPLSEQDLAFVVAMFSDGTTTMADVVEKLGARVTQAMDTLECTMDVQLAGSLAPGAHLLVIEAPNTPLGYYEAIHAATDQKATIASLSWGGSESEWSATSLRAIHRGLETAAHLDLTICCASGDRGSANQGIATPLLTRVGFPASSPFALACGGTALRRVPEGGFTEQVWSGMMYGTAMATGGGVSGVYPRPWYQRPLDTPSHRDLGGGAWLESDRRKATFRGRGVPDVAANADPSTGYLIHAGGLPCPGSGTSAAAPVWAALLARIGESLAAPPGWVHHHLYRAAAAGAFREIVGGDNRTDPGLAGFDATAGWNGCVGLGVPHGEHLVAYFRGEATPGN